MKRLLVILLVAMAVASFLDGWTWAANPPAIRVQDYSWVCRAFYLTPWVIFAFKSFGLAVFGLFVAGTIVLTRGASSLAERLTTLAAYLTVGGLTVWTTYGFIVGIQSNIIAR
jgi:hypothetical protein